MRLIAPDGVRVRVSDEKGERLKKQGWKEPQSEKIEVPTLPSPKRRGRPKKPAIESES